MNHLTFAESQTNKQYSFWNKMSLSIFQSSFSEWDNHKTNHTAHSVSRIHSNEGGISNHSLGSHLVALSDSPETFPGHLKILFSNNALRRHSLQHSCVLCRVNGKYCIAFKFEMTNHRLVSHIMSLSVQHSPTAFPYHS